MEPLLQSSVSNYYSEIILVDWFIVEAPWHVQNGVKQLKKQVLFHFNIVLCKGNFCVTLLNLIFLIYFNLTILGVASSNNSIKNRQQYTCGSKL